MIVARKNIISAIQGGDLRTSQWWLDKHDFANQQEEPPPAEPETNSSGSIYEDIRAFEQEFRDYQKEFPNGIGVS
jgi:hypothetical protein